MSLCSSTQALAASFLAYLSRHVTSRHVTSRHSTSRHVTSRHVIVMSCHCVPPPKLWPPPSSRICHTSRHVTARHSPSRHVTSRHATSRHVMSYHVMSFHVMSCHVMSSSCHCIPPPKLWPPLSSRICHIPLHPMPCHVMPLAVFLQLLLAYLSHTHHVMS